MKDPTVKPGIAVLIIRWIAGVWSIASIGFVVLILVGGLVYPHAPLPTLRDLVGMFFFPFGTCVGMILAWRWEALGGSITVSSLLVFYAMLRVTRGRCPRGPVFALVAAPGILFLLSRALTVARKRRSVPLHITS